MRKPLAKKKQPLDFGRSAVSRYIQLTTLFRRRIESGQWPVDQQIPTVEALALECGVARATIRQALGVLEDEKLIERFRAKGTFVIGKPRSELWAEVATDWSGLLTATPGATIELISDEAGAIPSHVEHAIGDVALSYRHLRRRHWRRNAPFLVADTFIDEKLSARIPQKDIETKSAIRLMHELPGLEIVDVRQTMTIGLADMETAQLLKVSINSPVGFVRRTAVDKDGCLVYIGDGIYRGDVVRVDFKLSVGKS
jgi:GntR family transcriptional regulator